MGIRSRSLYFDRCDIDQVMGFVLDSCIESFNQFIRLVKAWTVTRWLATALKWPWPVSVAVTGLDLW